MGLELVRELVRVLVRVRVRAARLRCGTGGTSADPGAGASGSSTGTGTALTDEQLAKLTEGASDWAKPELKDAIRLHSTDAVTGGYRQPITREGFAGIAVKL